MGVRNDRLPRPGGKIVVPILQAQDHARTSGLSCIHGCVEVGRRKPEQAPMTHDDSRRPLKVQVKSGRGRTLSSKLWLDRQPTIPMWRARGEAFVRAPPTS